MSTNETNEHRCLRCGDAIVQEGVNYRCIGCHIRLDRDGRKHPKQWTKAQRAKAVIERRALAAITEGFGPVEQIGSTGPTFGESRRLAESKPPRAPATTCATCRRMYVIREGKVMCLKCGEIRPT